MALSPMMQQYLEIKDTCKDSLLFFRLGDFYEMFYDDALIASRELELTLTSRDCGMPERAPMCGVPYHAVDSYLTKLIQKGYKVTICEQTTPPKGKGIIKRSITRVVTPGTVTESSMLTEDKNNYIVSLYWEGGCVGISWADISTGEFNHTYIDGQVALGINDLLSRLEPAEIICNQQMLAESLHLSIVKCGGVCPFTAYDETAFDYDRAMSVLKEQISARNIAEIQHKHSICAAGALLSYIKNMQKCALPNLTDLQQDESDLHMALNANTRRTLELTQSLTREKKGSLFWSLDRTKTGMGARLLKKWIEQPEIQIETIQNRLDFVQELTEKTIDCKEIHAVLDSMYDIERLTGRLSGRKILPVDFLALAKSLRGIAALKSHLAKLTAPLAQSVLSDLGEFSEDCDTIEAAILDKNAKLMQDAEEERSAKKNGAEKNRNKNRIFNKGYDAQLDEYINLLENSHGILEQLLAVEKEETGIKTLKIGYTGVFGYYIEVPKAQIDSVPYRYTRKQTVATGERYITPELKELEEKILNAEELFAAREGVLYARLMDDLSRHIPQYIATAKSVAVLDCIVSFAIAATENGYVKPIVHEGSSITIREGRHPVVEKLLKDDDFVPNDTYLDAGEHKIMLITGPNMAGKSIYMKQVALIVIMAQMGSFIPAAAGDIGIVDKIFTRVGASDDLVSGRSTFMVEMSEVTDILKDATDKSLLLLDEIGRGTSTFDGLSIARAIIEHLSQNLRAKVLFSTHYHELTDLEDILPGVKNYKLTVRELGSGIIFLRKVMRGSANRSFGIEVAGLAGLPPAVLKRAKDILKHLETSDLRTETPSAGKQLSLFVPEGKTYEIVKILNELDVDGITPRAALDILIDLKEKASAQ